MKKYLLSLLLLFLFANSFGQLSTFEKAIKPDYYAGFAKILTDTNDQWFIAGSFSTSYLPSQNYLVKCDSSGNTLWTDSALDTVHSGSIEDVIRSSDGSLVLCGTNYLCEGTGIDVFIKKVDTGGTLQWIRNFTIDTLIGGASGRTKVIQLSGNKFLITAENIIYKTDSTGNFVWTDTLTNGPVFSLLENKQHQYLIGSTHGISVVDSAGNVLSNHPVTGGAQEIILAQDTGYFVLSGTDFNYIDTAFAPILTLNLSGYFSFIQQIKYSGNEWWILGRDNSIPTIVNLNSSLSYINSFSFGDAYVIASDIDISSTRIGLAGAETTASNSNMFVKTFLKDGTSAAYSTDAGIVNIRYDSVYTVHHIALPPGVSDLYFDTYVTVKNFGQDTLKDVFINSKFFAYSLCDFNYYMHQFSGLNILPNDTVELYLGLLWDPQLYCPHICTFDYCFWTSCPNGKVDKNHSNDSLCNGITIDFQTGLQQLTNDGAISIFPNPAQSEISIRLPEEKNQHTIFEIKNLLGENILSGELTGRENKVGLSGFSPGIYFISIHTADKIVTRKIIKE